MGTLNTNSSVIHVSTTCTVIWILVINCRSTLGNMGGTRTPVTPENLKCVVNDWVSMRCTWDLVEKYYHPEDITVRLFWIIKGAPGVYECEKYLTNSSCEWTKDYRSGTYWMKVEVNNTVTNEATSSEVLNVNTKNIVKPGLIQNLTAKTVNSTCLKVEWTDEKYCRNKTCEIQLEKPDMPEEKKVKINYSYNKLTGKICQQDVQVYVPDLYPSVKYNVSVRCRPIVGGNFSNTSYTMVNMPEDAPSGAPELSAGSYKEIPGSHSRFRKVTVYWKPIPEAHKNGVITAYHMSVNGKVENFTDAIEFNQGTVQLNSREDYEITVSASTKEGISPQSSPLLIKASDSKPSPPDNFNVIIYSKDTAEVHFSWDKRETGLQSVTGYTIYYCQAWKLQQKCKGRNATNMTKDGDLQWINLHNGQRNYSMTLSTASDEYMFGISADTPNFSSGLVWSTCTFLYNRVPTQPPKNFRFADLNGDLSLTVQWDMYDCDESGRVSYYILSYGLLTTEEDGNMGFDGPPTNLQVKAGKSSYTLEGLKDEKKYSVSLQAVTEGGPGPVTAWINGTAVKKGLDSGEKSAIAVPVIIVLCCSVLGLVICGRKCKKCLLDSPVKNIILPPASSIPDLQEFDSYKDTPGCHKGGPLPAPSPTIRTSVMSNDNSTVTTSASDSNMSKGLIDGNGQSAEVAPGPHQENDVLHAVWTSGTDPAGCSSGNGQTTTAQVHVTSDIRVDAFPNTCNVEQQALRTSGNDPVSSSSGNSRTTATAPVLSYIRVDALPNTCNIEQKAQRTSGDDLVSSSSGNSQTTAAAPVSSYIRVDALPNTCNVEQQALGTSGNDPVLYCPRIEKLSEENFWSGPCTATLTDSEL